MGLPLPVNLPIFGKIATQKQLIRVQQQMFRETTDDIHLWARLEQAKAAPKRPEFPNDFDWQIL